MGTALGEVVPPRGTPGGDNKLSPVALCHHPDKGGEVSMNEYVTFCCCLVANGEEVASQVLSCDGRPTGKVLAVLSLQAPPDACPGGSGAHGSASILP